MDIVISSDTVSSGSSLDLNKYSVSPEMPRSGAQSPFFMNSVYKFQAIS